MKYGINVPRLDNPSDHAVNIPETVSEWSRIQSKRNHLVSLPVEILNQICSSLAACNPLTWRDLLNFRLVCRDIEAKSRSQFARLVYSCMATDVSFTSLSRISSDTDTFRCEFVEAIRGLELRPMVAKFAQKRAFKQLLDGIEDHDGRDEEVKKRKHGFKTELQNDSGAARSSGDSATLTTLLQKLPNLTAITVNADPPAPEEPQVSENGACADLFTTTNIVLPAIGWSGIELERLECGPRIYSAHHSGIPSMQAHVLGLPAKTLVSFASLRVLRLFLNADEVGNENHTKYGLQCTSRFLQHTPNLTDLHLCFSTFANTTTIFDHIVSSVTLPHLQALALEGLQIDLSSLQKFLSGRETRLQRIQLANNMLRSGSWSTIFLQLATFEHLTFFFVNQLSERHNRVAFPGFGYAETIPIIRQDCPALGWELVRGPEYLVSLRGEIDRMDERLMELADCVKMHRFGVEPDMMDDMVHIWAYYP